MLLSAACKSNPVTCRCYIVAACIYKNVLAGGLLYLQHEISIKNRVLFYGYVLFQ